MLQTAEKRKRGRPPGRVKGSLRDLGMVKIAIDAQTRELLKVIAGDIPISLWVRREVSEHYFRLILDLEEKYEILGFEGYDPILGKAKDPKQAEMDEQEPIEEEPWHNEPCDLTDIETYKRDYREDSDV